MNIAANRSETGGPPSPQSMGQADLDLVLRRLADDLAFGADASLFVGSGLEYASSRPYQPGDSIRSFNWRLTARTGKPFVREYEALKRTCVYLVLDTSASMAVASTPRSKHDLAFWCAGALGLAAQRRMSPVAVIGAGERATRNAPSLRESDLRRSLDPLLAPRFNEGTRLAERIRELAARAPRTSALIVLSDLHDADAVPAIRHAAQRHDCLVLHTIDPAESAPLSAGFVRAREAESGRVALVTHRSRRATHAFVQRDILRSGADYLALRTDQPFIAPLRAFLASRGGLRRGSR